MKHFSLFLLLLVLGLVPGRAQTPAALQAGDIVLLGQNATGPDDFAFTTLVDLAPGTQVKFTDKGWLPAGGFGPGEGGVCVYTVPAAGLAKGTVVRFAGDSARFTHPAGFALGTDGDQILAYQGTEAAPTFLYALAYKQDWGGAAAANASALPPGLISDSTAVFVPYLNGAYAAGSPHAGTADATRDATLSYQSFDA